MPSEFVVVGVEPQGPGACREDVQAFDSLLKEHQRALLPDGFSVLESAVIQHNIRSVAGMYDNITLDQLAALLGLSVSRVETLTCDMISEGRLKGHVDQARSLTSLRHVQCMQRAPHLSS